MDSGERSAATGRADSLPLEALLRITDDLPVGVAVLTWPDCVYRYANAAFQEMVPSERILGRTFQEIWPKGSDTVLEILRRVIETGHPEQLDDYLIEIPQEPGGQALTAYYSVRFCRFEMDDGHGILIEASETTLEVEARRRAEAASSDAERTARTLSDVFERMADGFIALDDEWQVTYANGRAEALVGMEKSELVGRNFWEAFPEAVETVFHEKFVQAMQRQEPVNFEEYYPPTHMWASVHALPSPNGLSVYLSDITSKKQVEAALAKSEGQLRAVIDNSPAVIYMKDLEGRFLRVNDEFVRLFGVSKESIVGKSDHDIMDAATADMFRLNDRIVSGTGEPHQFEEEATLPGGKRVLYLTTKFPLKDASGRVYGTAGISTDIDERVRQERKLAKSEQRFRKIFEEGPLGVALLDTSLTFRQVNDRYAEMLGQSRDALQGKAIADVTHPDDLARSLEMPRQMLRGEIPYYRLEKRFVRKDGSVIWGSIHGSLIRDDAGQPMFILSLAEDISQRKAAETALRDKDLAIRKAYSDVIAAVTGGKLVLMTPEELDAVLGDPVSDKWHVDEYAELSTVRRSLAEALLHTGMEQDAVDSFVLASCEGFTNAIKHGGGGDIRVHRVGDTVQIAIIDHGKGIDFEHLPKAALIPGFSTVQSLGMGFTIMLEVCDRMLLSTQPGFTAVVLEATGIVGGDAEKESVSASAPRRRA